jgi:hypothetical protein
MPRSFFAEGLVETEDGEKLTLVCDFFTIQVVEQISGLNWDDDILPSLINPPKHLAILVLYGLLRKRQEHITLDEAAGLTYDKHAIAIWAIVGDVIRRACNFGEAEQEVEAKQEAAPPKKKSAGRSRSSVASG